MGDLLTIPATVATSVSALVGRSVVDAEGVSCGWVQEFAVDLSKDQMHVAALVLHQRVKGKLIKSLLPVAEVVWPEVKDAPLRTMAVPEPYNEQHEFLLLDYDLLDQQIIDVDGRKVVRVNDVNLAWELGDRYGETAGLRIVDVEVGNRVLCDGC